MPPEESCLSPIGFFSLVLWDTPLAIFGSFTDRENLDLSFGQNLLVSDHFKDPLSAPYASCANSVAFGHPL